MVSTEEEKPNFMNEESPDIKLYLYRFWRMWYWFVLSAIIGIGFGYLYSRYQKPEYEVKSSIIYNRSSKSNTLETFLEESWNSYSLIDNQMGILKSYILTRQTIEKLNWRVSWFRTGIFLEEGLYKSEPFRVVEPLGAFNQTGVPIKITVLSKSAYMVNVDKKITVNGTRQKVNLARQCRFGEPFTSPLFNFILDIDSIRPVEGGAEYSLVFNDLNELVSEYNGKLNVDLLKENSEILSLKVKGTEPQRDIDFLNEIMDSYIAFGLKTKNQESENAIRFIDSQLSNVNDSLRRSSEKFTDFRSGKKIFDLTQEGSVVTQQLVDLEKEKATAEMQMNYLLNLKKYLGNAEQMKQVVAPAVIGVSDPLFNDLVKKMIDLYTQREMLSASVKENSPNMEMINREISLARKTLDENLKNIIANAQMAMKHVNGEIEELTANIATMPLLEQQMIGLKGRYEMNKDMSDFLLKKRAEAAIMMASTSPDGTVLDAARPETIQSVSPAHSKFIAIGFLLGLLFPLLVIFIFDYFNDKIRSYEQVEKKTKIPMIGTIAHNHYSTDYPVIDYPKSSIAESFRGLRTNLQFMMPDPSNKVISVHSVVAGEGKTFTSLNLASIIALNSRKVVLVGCDLRRPQLQKILGTTQTEGLSNYLIGQANIDQILRQTEIKGLYFIPSGHIPPNPAELLENPLFEQFLAEVRERFDTVILDNAPMSIIADGLIVGSKSDTNLFILRQDYSFKEEIKFINSVFSQGKLPHLCIALNDVRKNNYYSYGYGYRYYQYGAYDYNYRYGGYYYSDTSAPKTLSEKIFGKKSSGHHHNHESK